MVVELWSNVEGRLAPGATFATGRGALVVEGARAQGARFLVRFAGVADRTGAEALRGLVLRAPAALVEGALFVHELVGARVVSLDGRTLGTVAAVEANPASDLLVLDGGALVPLRFVTEFVPGATVTVDVPDGLVE